MLKMNIIKNTYIELLNLYIKKQPNKKLKYLYTDTTCIKNKYGSELVKYNGHKKMNCTKVSFITDSNGIPINVGTCILCFFVILAKNFFEIFS